MNVTTSSEFQLPSLVWILCVHLNNCLLGKQSIALLGRRENDFSWSKQLLDYLVFLIEIKQFHNTGSPWSEINIRYVLGALELISLLSCRWVSAGGETSAALEA